MRENRAGTEISHVAASLVMYEADRRAERPESAGIDTRLRAELPVVSDRKFLVEAKIVGRVACDDTDCADRGVSTEQGALRSP